MIDKVYILDTKSPLKIGAVGMDAIIQNIKIILLTFVYSVPLDRSFANTIKMLDSPAPAHTARLTAQIVDALEKYEPRIKVRKVEFVYEEISEQLMQGRMIPKITYSVKNEAPV